MEKCQHSEGFERELENRVDREQCKVKRVIRLVPWRSKLGTAKINFKEIGSECRYTRVVSRVSRNMYDI